MKTTAYRPRNPGHDYYGRGTYLVTLVVSGRERLLSHFTESSGNKGTMNRGELVLSPLGEAVEQAWLRIPEAQAVHGNHVRVHACVCMPDHFHGVIEVMEPMEWSLGDIIQAFKALCTSHWQRQQGLEASVNRPILVDLDGAGVPSDSDFSRFHNLNILAAEICAFDGEAKIMRCRQ